MSYMRIDRERLRALFIAGGVSAARRWGHNKLLTEAATSPPHPNRFENIWDADTAEALWRAVRAGELIEYVEPPEAPTGVLETIIAVLRSANEAAPISHVVMHKILIDKFPEREPDKLMTTIRTFVPSRLHIRRYPIRARGDGYWIDGPMEDRK